MTEKLRRSQLREFSPENTRLAVAFAREGEMTADASPVGCTGVLVVGTRGDAGPGEVLVRIRGGSEAFLAFSDEPLPKGATVLIVETRGARSVGVTPWTNPWGDL